MRVCACACVVRAFMCGVYERVVVCVCSRAACVRVGAYMCARAYVCVQARALVCARVRACVCVRACMYVCMY